MSSTMFGWASISAVASREPYLMPSGACLSARQCQASMRLSEAVAHGAAFDAVERGDVKGVRSLLDEHPRLVEAEDEDEATPLIR